MTPRTRERLILSLIGATALIAAIGAGVAYTWAFGG